ncbi:sensor histidine kinase [Rathayibacter tanaceti]|uniref:histidine kinase n=2 Tax=Rathayibacter tanaceti TaxID=1671680 RepID=A0A166INH8_9MICO|nr:histidine kinase [Rathayibacter tanaceti]KZX22672.1 Sensor histidine kinase LiaS [Rathayibacter tanaceti]QHC55569.1 sensor histidine kinase [Rathayibacter tanaceti]TCO39646.1 signal transduction histidine kinase [Rathayibacter tanaceti]
MSAAPTALGEAIRGYLQLWRRMPREALSLVLAVPLALVGSFCATVALALAVGLVGVLIGLAFFPAALHTGRFFSRGARRLDVLAGRPAVPDPQWRRPPASVSPATFAFYGPVIDGHYWLALLHTILVAPMLALVFGAVLALWSWTGIGTLVSALDGTAAVSPVELVLGVGTSVLGLPGPPAGFVSAAAVAMTVLFISTLPFATRGLTLARYLVDRLLLGPWESEALQREVAELSASRGAAVAAEDRGLRQLERDIHDGPQQRLIRVQMDLASARNRLASDPDSAARLVDEAREHVGTALDELRALSRGVAPPILQDRGLEAAVQSLAALSPAPVEVVTEHPVTDLPPEVERSVYFVIAELLANASKHASARSIKVHLDSREAGAAGERWLDAWVVDDGVGGAVPVTGHGLEGVSGRVRGLRGVIAVQSPVGGPTAIGVHVPYRPVLS